VGEHEGDGGLDPDAQVVVDAMHAVGFGKGLRKLGVDGARRLLAGRPVRPGLEVATVRELTLPGPNGGTRLRMYRTASDGPVPTLIWLHGGGWVMGGLDTSDGVCRRLADKTGCLIVNVDYRLAPEHHFPAAFDDALSVVRWLSANAADVGGDPTRLMVGGESAGANLAAAVAVAARDACLDLALQILVYPVTEYGVQRPSLGTYADGPVMRADDVSWSWEQYVPDSPTRFDWRATPANAPSHVGVAPAFIVTAGLDPLRDDGRAYAACLRDAGVAVDYREYAGVMHGFFAMAGAIAKATAATEDVAAAVERAVGPRRSSPTVG
jgi:acetyl esterase/lipase